MAQSQSWTTFADGKVTHPFNIAVVGRLVVSTPTTGAMGVAPCCCVAGGALHFPDAEYTMSMKINYMHSRCCELVTPSRLRALSQ